MFHHIFSRFKVVSVFYSCFYFIHKETPTQVFSCKFCKIFKNIFVQTNTSRRLLLTYQKQERKTNTYVQSRRFLTGEIYNTLLQRWCNLAWLGKVMKYCKSVNMQITNYKTLQNKHILLKSSTERGLQVDSLTSNILDGCFSFKK